jgi:hypothetical protein
LTAKIKPPQTPIRTTRARKLASTSDIRHEAARLYRDVLCKRMDSLDAARLCTILKLIADLVQGGHLEARLEALERVVHGLEEGREPRPRLNGGVIRHAARP